MPNHDVIYASQAAQYHRMIAAQPDLSDVISRIRPYRGLDILDMGAGTGRLSSFLVPEARSLTATDLSAAMLDLLTQRIPTEYHPRLVTAAADHRALPLGNASVDLIVSGWSVCYLASSNSPDWELNLERAMDEMYRVLRPGGTVILLETMGTGYETPHPPVLLLNYYGQLEHRYGFQHRWIRTDYTFDSPQEAEELTRFFFDGELADRVAAAGNPTVPECAGLWWTTKEELSSRIGE
ncbi:MULTISPECIES: class I SAM-dependent methyltransferase [Paenibacillus]|uniref:class I SAM-dependent methyltransferase n=1 Tax=Paenibacillus TaxID=44249 RepID=UPI0022B8F656|nr:class I SAM-dependent methyltransferase [Paenibacillus caseinilyticus]MCZ8523233.1 class I SAM-dependent methyltransferase [Paenibacillus caseinilyticus]